MSFNSFDLEEADDCIFDRLSIYDNIVVNQTDIKPIGTYCGLEKPPTMISTTRALTITFQSDESDNGQGFSIAYNFIDARNCNTLYHMLIEYILMKVVPTIFSMWWQVSFIIRNHCKH